MKEYKYKPLNKNELIELVNDENIFLGDIDVYGIEDLSEVFYRSERKDFSGINLWDTSKCKNLSGFLFGCENFNEELTIDTSNVENFSNMFHYCKNFNKPLHINTSKGERFSYMFYMCESFNQPIDCIDFSNAKYLDCMFDGCMKFNQSLGNLSKAKPVNIAWMFAGCVELNQSIRINISNCGYGNGSNEDSPFSLFFDTLQQDNVFIGVDKITEETPPEVCREDNGKEANITWD